MTSAADAWALAVAAVVVVAPGGALLRALGVRRPLWWIALTPPASVGVATITAMACAVLGVRYGPFALGLATGLLAAVSALRSRAPTTTADGGVSAHAEGAVVGPGETGERAHGRWGPWTGAWRAGRATRVALRQGWTRGGHRVPGMVLVAAGVGLGVLVWTHGLGGMATPGQEHDLIVHGVLTAYIQQSGHGAPWQLLPADVLTGQGVTFYPAGLHLLMAATAGATGSTVVGINAVSVVVLGAGWTSGSAALAHVAARRARLDPALALVAAGTAAIVAAGLYRPTIALVQWGGTVPNAATLALTPGLLAALLTLPVTARAAPDAPDSTGAVGQPSWRWPRRRRTHLGPVTAAEPASPIGAGPVDRVAVSDGRRVPVGEAVGVGVAAAGMLAIHPSAVVTVGVSALAWWIGEVLGAEGRRRILGSVAPLLVAGMVAAAVAAPMLLAMSRVATHIGAFQPDIDPISAGDALDRTLRMTYNAGDPRQKLAASQAVAGVAALAGAVVLAMTRRALGAVTAWLAWVAIVTATWVRPGRGLPGRLTEVFYDAQVRVWSHASLFVPTLAGVGLAVVASLAVDAVMLRPGRVTAILRRPGRRTGGAVEPPTPGDDQARVGRPRWAAVAVGGALAVAYLVGPGYRYGRTDVEALASRYARPDYTRVSNGDRRAATWLAARIAPGERVLNSANDGSTLLYVDRRVPIVNVASLGSAAEPATYRLLQGFNRYPVDADVRRMLRDLDVRWVYVDTSAPTVSASGAPLAWAGRWLSVPDGLRDLDGLPGLEQRYRSGSVSIYHLDPAAIAEADQPTEPAEPAERGTGSGEGSPSS